MVRKLICLMLCGAVLTGTCLAAPQVAAPSCILVEGATGTVLYEQDADAPLAPASVTKIMTLLLVMEAIDGGQLNWEDTVTASAHAASKGGSQIYLEEGEQMSLRDMVKCVVVSSANDCAAALAEAVSGSEDTFVERMNTRAAELGMENTHFENCTGLDDEAGADTHYSSPRDIAIMSQELLKHEEIREFTTIWMDTVREGTFGLSNTNKLVRFYPDTTGLKTGYTSAAGYCMSASAKRGGVELIAVVMNCETSTDRFESAKTLMEYGFANYALVEPEEDTEIPAVRVELGAEETIVPVPKSGEPIVLEKTAAARITRQVETAESVTAPVEQGQILGTLRLLDGETVVTEIPLVADRAVPRLTWGQVLTGLLRRLWMAE